MKPIALLWAVTATLTLAVGEARAQLLQYGPNITLEQARRVAASAEALAQKNGWPVAVAVVDTAGNLVLFHRLDHTMTGSLRLAVDKAYSAAAFRRPGRAFQDMLAGGTDGSRVLAVHGAIPMDGGLPLVIDGKVVGGIGVSGATADQDGQVARAGADAAR